jgi:hypothetical protein
MGWKQSFYRRPAHGAAFGSLKQTGAQRSRAKNRRVHDPLVQLGPRQAFSQRFSHEVHELNHPLPVLRRLLPGRFTGIGCGARAPKGHRYDRNPHHKRNDDGKNHGPKLCSKAAETGNREDYKKEKKRPGPSPAASVVSGSALLNAIFKKRQYILKLRPIAFIGGHQVLVGFERQLRAI